MANRRSVLIGLGGLVAGGGALLGTGAFTTVEAERTVTVQTAGDTDALLAFSAANDNPYVDGEGDTIQINLDGNEAGNANATGLNQNAITTFAELVQVTNNGTQAVTSLSFTIDVTGTTDNNPHEDAFTVVYDGNTYSADGTDILGSESLSVGDSLTFGIEIDLLNHGISEISPDAEYTLSISAGTE